MTRRVLILDALIALLGCLFAAGLAFELLTPLPLPMPAEPRPAPPAHVAGPERAAAPPGNNLVIVSKNLFSPSRSEGQGSTITASPKPLLHGVVMDGSRRRAYLEDPSARRTYGYAVGDTVAGGRVQSISGDRVIIARPDGKMEVLLQDPDKPKPEPTTLEASPAPAASPTAAAPSTPGAPAAVTPPAATSPGGAPAPAAEAPPAARRALPVTSPGRTR